VLELRASAEAAIGEDDLLGNALNFIVCAAAHELEAATSEPTYGAHIRGAREALDELSTRQLP
jgi:hypothetical protein